ncbi:MAG TPA: hypothetical protein VN428_11130 [Bryobacteraceae bacterium]|nr:hypothetical protein [Bryobacteraceae bacterium]
MRLPNIVSTRVLTLTAMALASAGLGLADDGCTLRTLRGTYVFAATGYNIVSGVAQPKAILEVIVFNGDGTLTVPAATVSINGTISRSSQGSGTYTVDSECRGTLAFVGGPSFDVVTSRAGKQLWMIQTNPNTVLQGRATRTSRTDEDD